MRGLILIVVTASVVMLSMKDLHGQEAAAVRPVWSEQIPAWKHPTEPESDTSTDESRTVAGRSVIRLGNVSTPELHIYPAAAVADAKRSTVVIAPGGGYSILAWDLEGTEVAAWLNGIGVDAVVLKYRVPTRSEPENWKAAVQDIQRAISLVKAGQVAGVGTAKVGVLGFSAGGNASARALTADVRQYESHDEVDQAACRPDFGVLVYPAWLVKEDSPGELIEGIKIDENTPPAFFAHAIDDRVDCMSSVTMFSEMKKHGLPASLHVFSGGGHGFGLRQSGQVTDQWPALCEAWLRRMEVIRP